MELRIKPFPKNSYPKKGLLIKGSSPSAWFQEMEFLGIDLNEIQSFPIPSSEPNILYGCFLIFKNSAPSEIGKNAYFQSVDDKLFIPENTVFYPKINEEDWLKVDSDFLIMHPDFGLVKLKEEIDWLSLIETPKPGTEKVIKPLNSVQIPKEIKSYTVEMDDAKILEALQKPQTEEEWMKNLPFDMKKVMSGNKKEIEKYLKYIEKYPDRTVDLGVPLDIMGTSRGDGFGKFKFGSSSWLSNLFGGGSGGSLAGGSGNYRWVFWVAMGVVALVRMFTYFGKEDPSPQPFEMVTEVAPIDGPKPSLVGIEKGITDIDLKIDSMFNEKRDALKEEHEKAMSLLLNPKKPELYEEYRKNGGRPAGEIQTEYLNILKKIKSSKDSLTIVYNDKIENYLEENRIILIGQIKDSLQQSGSLELYTQEMMDKVVEKKQSAIRDSMAHRFGTKEYTPPPMKEVEIPEVEISNNAGQQAEKPVPLSEILGLIALIGGVIFGYLFFVKGKSINTGGENISPSSRVFLMVILVVMLVFIFYPLIKMFGYNWFVWLLVIGIVFLLYRLFSEDKTILNNDKDE